jgi:hypothetical protein
MLKNGDTNTRGFGDQDKTESPAGPVRHFPFNDRRGAGVMRAARLAGFS